MMDWKRKRESELHVAHEGGVTFEQTWDGVLVSAGSKSEFVPMAEWSEERGREVAKCLTST